jgi:hypothetical protein
MNERIRFWLKMAPMPEFKEWLDSLYVDNILKVSRGGENVPAAFTEYGKKLLADRIFDEYSQSKKDPVKGFSISSGAEMLLGTIAPNEPINKED